MIFQTSKLTKAMAAIALLIAWNFACAQEPSDEDLAKELANPVAALISVPFQLNYDRDIGPVDEGDRWTMNIQPVIPIEINEQWNLISRTILPVIWQSDIAPGAGSQSGFGDTIQSLFFSPKKPLNGWILGVGPAFLLPTGSDDLLTADQWGAGPTGIALKQTGPWTYGALANHIWSFAGDSQRDDVNQTFLQPFVSYITPKAVTYSLNAEATYNWENEQWSIPLGATVSKVFSLGSQKVSLAGGLRYYAESSDAGPEGLGYRAVVTLLFPR